MYSNYLVVISLLIFWIVVLGQFLLLLCCFFKSCKFFLLFFLFFGFHDLLIEGDWIIHLELSHAVFEVAFHQARVRVLLMCYTFWRLLQQKYSRPVYGRKLLIVLRANKDELLRLVFVVLIQGFSTFRLWTLVAGTAKGTFGRFFTSLQTSLLSLYKDAGFHGRLFARWRLLRWPVRRCILT